MVKRKHILFLSSWYPSKVHTTNGNFVQRHAKSVSTLNDVTVLYVVSDPNISKVKTEKNSSTHFDELIIYIPQKKNIISKYLAFKTAYNSALKELKPIDLVHLNVIIPIAKIALTIIKKLNVPYIITEHSTIHLDSDQNNYSLIEKKLIRKALKNASYICPVSEDLNQALKREYNYQNSKIIRNVVDESIFYVQDSQKNEPKIILHISSYNEEQKNISGLLRVVKELSKSRSDFKLIMIGDGDISLPEKLKSDLNISNNFLEVLGKRNSEEIAHYLQKSDLFILFSNYENSPCVISEALMCGLPVISTDVGGISEMLDEKSGKLIPSRDENALLTTLSHALDNLSKFNNKLIASNAKTIYSSEVIAKQYNEIYDLCLNQK